MRGSAMRDSYAKGQPVEVRVRRPGTEAGEYWRKAHVIVQSGRGADIRFDDDGRMQRHHILFCDLRPIPPAKQLQPPGKIGTPVLSAHDIDRLNESLERPAPAPVLRVVEPPAPSEPPPPRRQKQGVQSHFVTPIAAYLRSERLRAGISQEQFARQIGVDDNAISRLELSRQLPSDEMLLLYHDHLKLDVGHMERLREYRSFDEMVADAVQRPAVSIVSPQEAVAQIEEVIRQQVPTRPIAEVPMPAERDRSPRAFLKFAAMVRSYVPTPGGSEQEWDDLVVRLWSL